MRVTEVGRAGVSAGWRKKVTDAVARPLASRTPVSVDHVRAALGLVFVALSVRYLVRTLGRAARD